MHKERRAEEINAAVQTYALQTQHVHIFTGDDDAMMMMLCDIFISSASAATTFS